jgi:hypothetical protein
VLTEKSVSNASDTRLKKSGSEFVSDLDKCLLQMADIVEMRLVVARVLDQFHDDL